MATDTCNAMIADFWGFGTSEAFHLKRRASGTVRRPAPQKCKHATTMGVREWSRWTDLDHVSS